MQPAFSFEIESAISLNRRFWTSDEPTTEIEYSSFMELDSLLNVFRVAVSQGCEEFGIELSDVRARILALFNAVSYCMPFAEQLRKQHALTNNPEDD